MCVAAGVMRVKSETAGGEVTTLSRRRPGNAWLVKSSSVSTDCEVIQVCGEGVARGEK